MKRWLVGNTVITARAMPDLAALVVAGALAMAACGNGHGGGGKTDGPGPSVFPDDGGPPDSAMFVGPWPDFPSDPVIEMGAPANAAMLFGPGGGGLATGGPCLVEPQVGSLFPRNWLRPRFRFVPADPAHNLFEIRLHTSDEVNDLVVYTTTASWTMPLAMWSGLTAHASDAPITVTVRGATLAAGMLTGQPARGSSGTINIAPVEARGSIVYWTTSNNTRLRGFSIGDEKVQDVLTPGQAQSQCVGCHSSTPDGLFVGFSSTQVPTDGDPAVIDLRTVDGKAGKPAYLSASAQALLARVGQELPAFSKGHWTAGDRIALSMLPLDAGFEIAWTDLETASMAQGVGWGVIARNGDSGSAASGSLSHDGKQVLYVTASSVHAGITVSDGDLATVPYSNRKGGAMTRIAGASSPAWNEYYPVYSPDDQYVAFNRAPIGSSSYDDPDGEVFVIAASGGTPRRLAANDPPACAGKRSPGLTNSWVKWAPEAATVGTKTYYWLTFSSKRTESGNPQLYVAPVVVDSAGESPTLATYPALYLWNQPEGESNHTPAWDVFQIPIP